jgi:hypothetical protein
VYAQQIADVERATTGNAVLTVGRKGISQLAVCYNAVPPEGPAVIKSTQDVSTTLSASGALLQHLVSTALSEPYT